MTSIPVDHAPPEPAVAQLLHAPRPTEPDREEELAHAELGLARSARDSRDIERHAENLARRGRESKRQPAGRMFWFMRNRLSGSYFFFTATRRP